jgi:hypothetical protein
MVVCARASGLFRVAKTIFFNAEDAERAEE